MKQGLLALFASLLPFSSNSFGQTPYTQTDKVISHYIEPTLLDSSTHHPITLNSYYYEEIVLPDTSITAGQNASIVRRNYDVNFKHISYTELTLIYRTHL